MQHTIQSDLKQALSSCRSSFFAAAGFSLVINILMLAPTIYMLQLYDRVLSSRSESTLLMLTLIVIVIYIAQGSLEWVRTQILVRISAQLDINLNKRLYHATYQRALHTAGKLASAQPLDDLTALRQFLTGNGLFAFFDAPWLPIYIGLMFLFHAWYGWVAVFSAFILITLALFNEALTYQPLEEANHIAMNNRRLLNDNLRNVEVIHSMGMLNAIQQRWLENNIKVLNLQSIASSHAGLLSALSKTLRLLLQSLILGLGAYLAIKDEITPGMMIAGSILLGRALAPIDLLIANWKGFTLARGQYARLDALLQSIPKQKDTMPLPTPKGHIQLNRVVLIPPNAKLPAIKDISLQIPIGASLGIIGSSGAGKSSLVRAILGIWPIVSGNIRLDGADIFTWDREALGEHIGYLPQDIELFSGTISENIARFRDFSPEQVVAAAKMANVHQMILQLSEGYDTVISAGGGHLSGGQKQRIGLARALYGQPKLVVLDEPNSNLDDQGENALGEAIKRLKERQVTVIVVTHRTQVLAKLDLLLLLNNGQLTMYGPRDQVLLELQKQHMPPSSPQVQS